MGVKHIIVVMWVMRPSSMSQNPGNLTDLIVEATTGWFRGKLPRIGLVVCRESTALLTKKGFFGLHNFQGLGCDILCINTSSYEYYIN